MRVFHLDSVENVRELGGLTTADGRAVKRGLIFRGSALSAISEEDSKRMFDDLGISCVVDLRCGWEVTEKPNNVGAQAEHLHIPFYDKEKVGIEYTERAEGTKVVGRDIACNPIHFYGSLANPLTARQMGIAATEVLGRASAGQPVYYHCSGGKDRAGILTLLLLTILGVDKGQILEDYLLTNQSRDKHYDSVYERFLRLANGNQELARKLTDDHRAKEDNLEAFYGAVDGAYGSMRDFIEGTLGIDAVLQEHYRDACTQ